MCLPTLDLDPRTAGDRSTRKLLAKTALDEGNKERADFILSGDKAFDTVADFIKAGKKKELDEKGARAAEKRLAPDAADAVLRRTGASPIPLGTTLAKSSRSNSFVTGPGGVRALLGRK